MPENLPRALLAITLLVAVVAIVLGIRDYVGRKKDNSSAATASASNAVDSNSAITHKKSASGKTKRGRLAASRGNGSSAGPSNMEKGLASDKTATSAANAMAANSNLPGNATTGVGKDSAGGNVLPEAAYDGARKNASAEARYSDDEIVKILSNAECVPLPNLTQPGDVDAPYYQNWAREYGCVTQLK
jgi:hypothetical protein